MECHGNGVDHCCLIKGTVCSYLEENTVAGRRWACGLFRRHETWDNVYASVEYQDTDAARWFADHYPGYGCGDWPQNIPEVMETPGLGRCCYG